MFSLAIAAFISLAFFGGCNAGSYSYEFKGKLVLELSLGTPAQGPFLFEFDPVLSRFRYHMPTISDKDHSGQFLPKNSTSFKFGRILNHNNGYNGTETVKFLNGPEFQSTEITLDNAHMNGGSLSLSHGENGKVSFMDRVLEDLGGKRAIVLAIKESKAFEHFGTIVLGDDQPQLCAKNFTVYPARPESHIQMTLNSTELEAGKYHQIVDIPLVFSADYVMLEPKTFEAVAREFGVQLGHIDCSTKKLIQIRTQHHEFTIGPEEYIENRGDYCHFSVLKAGAPVIMLPLRFIQRQCLRYDFEANTMALAPLA